MWPLAHFYDYTESYLLMPYPVWECCLAAEHVMLTFPLEAIIYN